MNLSFKQFLLSGASALLLSACQTNPVATDVGPVEKHAEILAQDAQKYSSKQQQDMQQKSAVDQLLLTGVGGDVAVQDEPEETFDIAVKDMDSRNFFLSLVSGTDNNVVVHPEVSGTISLGLKNVTIDQVLDTVRDIYGYEYKLKGSIYTIYPRKLRTEIFKIDYLDVKRVGVSDTSVLIGKIDSEDDSNNNSSSDSDEGTNLFGMAGMNDQENGGGSESISPGSRVQTLTRTDFGLRSEKP